MLTRFLTRIRALLAGSDPWTNVYGVARSLLAISTMLTLAFNRSSVLFRPLAGHMFTPPLCMVPLQKLDLFCVTPGPLPIRQWIAVALLAVVASGWRPRLTGVVHWFVCLSFQLSATTLDGGDQAASVLTFAMLPLTLTDDRKWHWSSRPKLHGDTMSMSEELKRVIAWSSLIVIRIQVAGIYFHAAVAKLDVTEWADGTAMYYWLSHPVFGANDTAMAVLRPLLTNAVSVSIITWGVIILELFLFMGLLAGRRARHVLLVGGLALHSAIIFIQGLFSFGLVMFAALILYLRPVDELFAAPARIAWRRPWFAAAWRRPTIAVD